MKNPSLHDRVLLAVVAALAVATSSARAVPVTGYLYEIDFSGTFGKSIDPNISNLPDNTYPFPQMRGGSFNGTFVYDSLAFLDQPPSAQGRFPFVSVNVNIFDNLGTLANTITIAPNNFFVSNHSLGLNFGESSGPVGEIDDLRLSLDGSFSLHLPPPPPQLARGWGRFNDAVAPPPPAQITAAILDFGFLETDGSVRFTYWDLPVTQVVLTYSGATSYVRTVPDGGNTISQLTLGLFSLCAIRTRLSSLRNSG